MKPFASGIKESRLHLIKSVSWWQMIVKKSIETAKETGEEAQELKYWAELLGMEINELIEDLGL